MFTGIVKAVATIETVQDQAGIRTFAIRFPADFCTELTIGASVAVDGVCLTVTQLLSDTLVSFDVMLQSLKITTLGSFAPGAQVNVERAAKEGAEIGGHPLSGHVDFCTEVSDFSEFDGNCRIRFSLPPAWSKYIFPKGYIAINGASLTLAEVDKKAGFFEVWLIPETRRATTFNAKQQGVAVNIEIERSTQVVVDTIEATLERNLGKLYPLLTHLLQERAVDLTGLLAEEINISGKP
jgi:riboflavin synthase